MEKRKPHNFKNRIGEKHITKQGYEIEIIKYINAHNLNIMFEDGAIIENTSYDNVLKRKVENPKHKTVFGVGFLGTGKYKTTFKSKICKNYQTWRCMMQRCYDEKSQEKQISYKNTTVCEEWHNFQNFAEWMENNYNPETMQGWQLDKDILIKGNKIYSPDTCCFVPQEINIQFIKSNSVRGEFPIGVCYIKKRNVFMSYFNKNKKRYFLGHFNTIEKAFQAYKTAKEQAIKEAADEWKDKIVPRVYQAMYNYEVEITD